MIRLSYALKLARTKLRSRRGVLIASIIVSSLLFAALIAMVIVFTGAEKSATEFIKKAGNDRYLVKVSPYIPTEAVSYFGTPTVETVRIIKAYEKQYYKDLKAKYTSLGLDYDSATEVPALTPLAYASPTLPEEQRVMVNYASPVIVALNQQKFEAYAKTATNKYSDLKTIGDKYDATGYALVDVPSKVLAIPNLRYVQDGKEDFSVSERKGGPTPQDSFTNAIYNGNYVFNDQKLLSRYLLNTDTNTLQGVPIVISAQEAASLFGTKAGISKEPSTPAEKKIWLKDIQSKLNGTVYQACYRNSAEQTMLQKIQTDYATMKANEQNKDYVKPSLLYDYPTTACGDIVVKQDTRTAPEKQLAAKNDETQKKLGTYVAPAHQLVTFQVVGIEYAEPFLDRTKNVSDYVKSLLVSQDDPTMSASIPIQMYDSLPSSLKLDAIQKDYQATFVQNTKLDQEFAQRVLEFKTPDSARTFLDKETCTSEQSNSGSCSRKFVGTPYKSNYLILDEIGKLFGKVAAIAFPAVLGVAAIIIWFTISRIMVENRKETAVYRAMGAKRRDVTSIYVVYVLLIALQIATASVIIGTAAAFAVDHFYGSTLTDTAVTAFGIIDDAPRFSLFNLASPLLFVVIGSIFIISIIASIQPLIRNVRRSPIRDMRDE